MAAGEARPPYACDVFWIVATRRVFLLYRFRGFSPTATMRRRDATEEGWLDQRSWMALKSFFHEMHETDQKEKQKKRLPYRTASFYFPVFVG